MLKLAEMSVRRPVFAATLILGLVAAGIFSYLSLGVDRFPRDDFTTITVTIVNRGASPEEIETEITEKVESAVSPISGIDELRSSSVEGVSQIFITFALEKSPEQAVAETRDKIESIRAELPDTSEPPIITKLDADATPVLRLVVSGPSDLRVVTEVANRLIRERLESVSGVGQVQLIGGSRREIQIRIDPNRLRAYNLTASEAAAAIHSQNLPLPGGRISEGPREAPVRTLGRISDPAQFNEIVIATREGFPVKVRDIGQAVDASEETRTASFLNDRPVVSLLVSKQSGRNTVTVADSVKKRVEEIRQILPPGYSAEILGDQSVFSRAAVRSLWRRLVTGGLLAALVVYLFLRNIRSAMIAAIAIPTSIISSFALMAAMNYTFNQITLTALALTVGIVIDDVIVVLENIHRYVEERGLSPFRAAIEATRDVSPAALATTLSLLAIFLPVGFMSGGAGRFMFPFGLTVSFAIVVSVFIAFTLTPMLSARLSIGMERRRDGETEGRGEGGAERQGDVEGSQSAIRDPQSAIDRVHTRVLEWSMARRRIIVALSVITIISAIPLWRLIGKNFLPEDDQSQFEITARASADRSLPATITVLNRIADQIRRLPGVTDTLTTVSVMRRESGANSSIYVRLTDIENRDLSQTELMGRARELLSRFPKELRMSVGQVASISGAGYRNADVQFVISGPDLNKLTTYSEKLIERMEQVPYVVDAGSSVVAGRPEWGVTIDRQRAADLGARISDIAQALNILVAGLPVSTFIAGSAGAGANGEANADAEEYDVVVRATGQFLHNKEDLRQMTIPSAHGGLINLDQVVRIEEVAGPSLIDRLNRKRQVTVSANVRPGGSQSEVIAKLNKIFKEIRLEPNSANAYGYMTEMTGRSKELGRDGYYFILAIPLSFIFMYIVLAAQFESFRRPAAILLTLPLVVPFGLISLLLMGQTINIFSGLALLLLFGIVTKNAILQINHANRLLATGLPRYEAIIRASRDRLRPILMTTIAIVAAMLPLLIPKGPGSGTNRSIGAVVVGGQSLCLLLTLLALPVFYSLFEDLPESQSWRYANGQLNRIKTKLRERFAQSTIISRFRSLRRRTSRIRD
ncbi:MAG TPA: efflux RND transporter permease subunit [Blastocatellia bacterium]|nr:efflux RND transporter permease subunit [Blastocatellia bacterium]